MPPARFHEGVFCRCWFLLLEDELAAVRDDDGVEGAVGVVDTKRLDLFDDVYARDHMPEERVFSSEIVAVGECDKKSVSVQLAPYISFLFINYRKGGENPLRTICPFPTICHTHQPLAIDLPPPQVFVGKHFPT